MAHSSKSITLALIGSALFLSGCHRSREEEERERARLAGRGAVGGVFLAPRGGRGFVGRAPAHVGAPAHAGVSARGGFGATGSHGVGA